jgi:hypothetical protein
LHLAAPQANIWLAVFPHGNPPYAIAWDVPPGTRGATLRFAIGAYMRQHPGSLPANVASLLELPPGGRPKAPVWTGERARAAGGRVSPIDIWISTPRPSPVMVWTPAQTMVFRWLV